MHGFPLQVMIGFRQLENHLAFSHRWKGDGAAASASFLIKSESSATRNATGEKKEKVALLAVAAAAAFFPVSPSL